MILNCAIVDDEPLALELLQSYVEKTAFLRLAGKYSSAVQAMNEIPAHEEIHILFLDIQMPELNGLEFSHMVNPETRIIFTTAFGQYALDSYKVNALDYLLKPISYADFLQSVNKAMQWFELKQRRPADRPGSTTPVIDRKHFYQDRIQTGAGRTPQDIIHRRTERLHKNTYRKRTQSHLVTYQHEGYGRKASVKAFCTCTSLIHSAKKQNKGD